MGVGYDCYFYLFYFNTNVGLGLGTSFDLLSEEVGRDIGNGLGKVVEVDLKDFSSYQARFLRVRVE